MDVCSLATIRWSDTQSAIGRVNKRPNRLAITQEHMMILRVFELGASEDRIAAALHVKIDHIRRNRRLPDGISPDAAAILEDKQPVGRQLASDYGGAQPISPKPNCA